MSKAKSNMSTEQAVSVQSRPRRKARLEVPKSKARQPKQAQSDSTATVKTETPIVRARVQSEKKLSALDAAARVLGDLSGKAATNGLSAADLVERMASTKLWVSPGGKTPSATLSAAISREIAFKGNMSRFRKAGPGRFAANSLAANDGAKRASTKRSSESKSEPKSETDQ